MLSRLSARRVSLATAICVAACGGGDGGGTEPVKAPPATAIVIATQPVGAVSGTTLSTPPVVWVVTAGGTLATGSTATVTAALNGSAGSTLTGTTSVAAVGGIARFDNLVVSGAGSYSLTFSSPGLVNASTNAFGMSPAIGPPASLAFEPERTELQVGQSLAITPRVRDANGNALITPPLAYVARNAGIVAIDARGIVTAAARGQAVVVASIIAIPSIADSLLVVVAPPTGTILYSSLASFTVRRDTTITVSVYVDMRSSGKRLASGLVDVKWNPAQLAYVSTAAGAAFAPAVGEGDAASGRLHLSFADPNGFGGTVEIARITFRASATPGVAGSLSLSASEASTSEFTDLLADMIQVTQPLVVR